MDINTKTIKHLENLTMLKIEDEDAMAKGLVEVLTFMENLSVVKDVETNSVEDTIYREDIESPSNMDDFFKSSTKVVGNAFEVPKIL